MKKLDKNTILKLIKNNIIVSCQALPEEPLYVEEKSIMYLMARAAKMAGTPMIRTNSIRDVIAIKEETGLPVIGIIKKQYEGFESYITSTMAEVDALVEANSDVIALDATNQKRGDQKTAVEFIKEIKLKYPEQMLMADISTYEEGVAAAEAGVDLVSTTMSGYTNYTKKTDGADYNLLERLSKDLKIPVICEGRINYPDDVTEAFKRGAYAVVVGSAITRPYEIAKRFFKVLEK